ncbi:hypothetical protein ACGFW5_30485 [Streptomyces sp. NPDC048416]
MAAETMREILKKRKRTLTADMREMADHLERRRLTATQRNTFRILCH